MRKCLVAIPALLSAVLVAGCGHAGTGISPETFTTIISGPATTTPATNGPPATDPAATGPAAPAATATVPAAGEATGVPDACPLITPAELSAILGSQHAAGQPQRVGPDRSSCIYPTGTITTVELAAKYEATRDLIKGTGRKTQDVPGVGQAAFYDEAGQLIAKGQRFLVAIRAPGIAMQKLKQATLKLLEAAE